MESTHHCPLWGSGDEEMEAGNEGSRAATEEESGSEERLWGAQLWQKRGGASEAVRTQVPVRQG